MLSRFLTYRLALATLALLGQVTPAVVAPALAAVRPLPARSSGGCAPAACACPVVEKVAKGCCCSKPEPAPEPKPAKAKKTCCSGEAPSSPAARELTKPACESAPESHAVLASAERCSCDRSPASAGAAAEPAVAPDAESPTRWFLTPSAPLTFAAEPAPAHTPQPPQPPPPKV